MAVESVAKCPWSRWPNAHGISGQMAVEFAAKIEGLDSGSMLDLKTIFRARKYTRRILNSLGKNDEEFLIDDRIFQIAEIGRIHAKAA